MQYRCAVFFRDDSTIKEHNSVAPGAAPRKAVECAAHAKSGHRHGHLVQLVRILFRTGSNRGIIQHWHGEACNQYTGRSPADFIGTVPETARAEQYYSLLRMKHLPELARRAINAMPQHQNPTCFQQLFHCSIRAAEGSIRGEK